MTASFRDRVAFGVSAIALSVGWACSAQAGPPLPGLVNQNFTQYHGQSPKATFANNQPVGWTGGNGLIYIDGQAYGQSAAGGGYLTTYGNPTGSVVGNYVEADGNPTYESGFNYRVTGLTPHTTYTLSFYQGASEQLGFGFNSYANAITPFTDQWIVALGGSGFTLSGGGPTDPLYGPTDTYSDTGASIAASPLMTVCYQCTVGWDFVSVDLTSPAAGTTALLSFLAWGDNGSTVNLPPMAFLSGVDSPPGLGAPEPASLTLFGVGLAGLGAIARRRRGKRSTPD
jgi:hypothetical protein